MRYAVPFFLMAALIFNLLLASEALVYRLTILAQMSLYLAALLGWLGERLGLRLGVLALPYYYALANVASCAAFVKFMRGEAHILWEPIREAPRTAVE